MEKVKGLLAVIQVDGFQEAKAWIYELVRALIAQCASCDQPATHVFWQDEAEWYTLCEAHREYGQQWSGSTHWEPESFSKNLIADRAKIDAWHQNLMMRQAVKIEEFDATDYYALLPADLKPASKVLLKGTKNAGMWAKLWHLTNGEWAHEVEYESQSYAYSYDIVGAWATEAEALEAARKVVDKS